MQDHPGVPGSARQGNTGTDVPAACGGAAGQSKARDHTRSRAAPMPKAPDHNRSGAAPMPKVSDHNRSHAAPQVPDHDRSCTAPMPKALGHNRPHAASMALARPRCPWPGERRPKCADNHRPPAGPREPAVPGSLAPRRCHSPHPHLSAIPPKRREKPRCVLPSSPAAAIPLRHLLGASCHSGAAPPAACHRRHGLPTPLTRAAPGRPPKTYACQPPRPPSRKAL